MQLLRGPQVSFLLNVEYGDEGVSYKFDDRDDFNTIDYGVVVNVEIVLRECPLQRH